MHHRVKAAAWVALLFVALSTTLSRTAHAEPSAADKAAAETLFVDARKLLAAGKYTEACKGFAESQRLDPGVGTLLNLGRCYEKMGRTASAWSTYREAAAAARAANQGAREKNARLAAEALESKLPKLTIVVAGAETSPRLEVRRDGAVVPASMWGMSVAIDPGDHLFEASAPGYKPWRSRVVAEAGKAVTVSVPALEPDANATRAASTPAKSIPAESASVRKQRAPEPPPSTPSGLGGQRVAALVVGGAGLVSTAVGGYFAGYSGVGPNFLPWVVGAMLALCGVLLVREALTGGYREREEPSGAATGHWAGFAWVSAGVLVNAALITTIGFILSCSLCFVLAVRGFKSAEGRLDLRPRAWLVDAAVGFAIAAPVYWMFTQLLAINLPGLTATGWL